MALAPRLPWGMSEPEGLLSLALNDLDAALDTSLLRRLVGEAQATWMLLTGDTLDATAALRHGLVLAVFAVVSFWIALALTRKRFRS